MSGPLEGVKVLDLTAMISGPTATMILADQGAQVIKIENPKFGDYTRIVSTNRNGFSAAFLNNNRNKYSVAICNGTAALEVAIKSLNFPKKSRIMVPARSFFSSASCIVNTGHIPVFVDIDPLTQNISINDLKKKINSNIKAIICVHLGGLPCDMNKIRNLLNRRKIKIIEV